MAHGRVQLSGDEMRKFRIIKDVLDGHLSQKEGAEKANLSVRQFRRLQKRVEKDGASGIVHGLVGKSSNNALPPEVKKAVVKLWKEKYKDCGFNFTHFTEKLNEVENISVGKDSVRTLLRSENLVDKKPRKRKKHHRERPRRERFGELLQQDTSPHNWLSTGDKQNLVAVIDDATSTPLFAKLYQHDGTLPNMEAIDSIIREFGLPEAIYTDRASWFHYSQQGKKVINTHKENRSARDGSKGETQIGRAMEQLGVEFIPASSAQAKGRIERLNGSFQDRLISELRLHNITEISLANQFIEKVFLPDYVKRFAKEPACPNSAFIPLANPDCLNDILCLRFTSTAGNDNTVKRSRYYKLQLLPGTHRQSWAKAKVVVRIHLDRTVTVRHAKTNELIPFEVIDLNVPKEAKLGSTAFV